MAVVKDMDENRTLGWLLINLVKEVSLKHSESGRRCSTPDHDEKAEATAPGACDLAGSGKCLHRRPNCRGLRNANVTQAKALCQACQTSTPGNAPVMRPPTCMRMRWADPRCGGVVGSMLEVRGCKVCALRTPP